MRRLALAAALVSVTLGASACAGGKHAVPSPATGSTSSSATAQSPLLTDLRSIGQLQTLFNTASARPRLIILVSPT